MCVHACVRARVRACVSLSATCPCLFPPFAFVSSTECAEANCDGLDVSPSMSRGSVSLAWSLFLCRSSELGTRFPLANE